MPQTCGCNSTRKDESSQEKPKTKRGCGISALRLESLQEINRNTDDLENLLAPSRLRSRNSDLLTEVPRSRNSDISTLSTLIARTQKELKCLFLRVRNPPKCALEELKQVSQRDRKIGQFIQRKKTSMPETILPQKEDIDFIDEKENDSG
ncbi:hypothetical protein GLOIN_2v1764944 [Rhizophagus irregularis DAOM 181602=DAOM 197198]|nr:hypothetical protein GLOIN_2v1764944 [Rhizophagus irregularis DAOM 181602=DAOM 197198]